LRDEKTLRQALLGFQDGRQVAVQVLKADEELAPNDVVLAVRPWRVTEARLHAPTEIIVRKGDTVSSFMEMLTTRYKGLLHTEEDAEEKENATKQENVQEGAEEGLAKRKDALEVVVVPTVGGTLTISRCQTLKWSESRLSASASAEVLEKPLSEFKEIRDGVTLVVRSRLSALKGAPPEAQPKSGGKGKGKDAAGAARARAKSADGHVSIAAAAAAIGKRSQNERAERGLVIRVAHPEGPTPEPVDGAS